MKYTQTVLLSLAIGFSVPVALSAADDHAAHHPIDAKTADSAVPMSTGEVRKVDKDAGKVTIKHGPLDNLGMPAMTMVFGVKDPAMLEQVKEGDNIRFDADRIGGQFTVIRVEKAK